MHANKPYVSAPFATPEPGRGRSPPPPPPRRSILIVDDNPEKTLALQSVVEELDYQVVVAGSAEAGLRELLKQDFALALLDIHMPGMDGFELAALIRSRPAHHDLGIVFMSAIDQTDDRLENAYQLGAIDFIALPARRPVIKAKLASLLGLQEKSQRLAARVDEGVRRLEQSEERFRRLLANAEDVAIFFVDVAGRVVEWSRAAELCTGWPAGEIVGNHFAMFFVPGDIAHQVPRELLAAARRTPGGFSERWLVRKDGTRFWARFSVVALGGAGDTGFGVILRDITAQRDAEQELQIKAAVLEGMSESVYVVDAEFRIIYANPAATRTFGYEADELIGTDLRRLSDFPPAESDARIMELTDHFAHHREWVGEWPNRKKDGTRFLTRMRLAAMTQRGARYFVAVQEDLTSQQQADQAHERSAQLEEVVGELEAFSYSVSHDLKSPLRTLRGFADAVIQDYGQALQGPGLHYMNRIRHAAERLERMVEDILAVSRLPREALPLAPVDLAALLRSVVEDSPQFRPPHAVVTIAGSQPQVFLNLVGNAVKFVPAGRGPEVTIRAEVCAGEATIWVEDNGVGIRPEDHQRIFRPLERAEATQALPGSGVGLAIVKRTVERLGGTVGLHSEAGAGSRFWVKLRAVPELV
jgi:PAS domain S-box-containing protein